MNPDVTITNVSVGYAFALETRKARNWVAKHCVGEQTWLGGELIVEGGYAQDLAQGMLNDGLAVQ